MHSKLTTSIGIETRVSVRETFLEANLKSTNWHPFVLITLTGVWAIATYLARRAAGVTASDPYAYVQMALDLVHRGTPLHEFPLTRTAQHLQVAVWPTVHVGYHLPSVDQTGSASVWPPGTSILLGVGYLLAGERGLLWVTPFLGVLAVGMAGVLMYVLFPSYSRAERLWISAITVFVLATSYRQVELTITPMSDIPAQLFAVTTIWASVHAARKNSWKWGLLAGACLGISCSIRYTHILMLIPMLTAAFVFRNRSRALLASFYWLVPAGMAFIVLCMPLFWYHQVAFHSPLILASSEEATYFSLSNFMPVTRILLGEVLRTNEFFYLFPFMILGAWAIWQTERPTFVLLTAWVLGLTLFQLQYGPLRLRGVLSIMPVLAGVVGSSIVVWFRLFKSYRNDKGRLIATFAIAVPLLCLMLRSRVTLLLPLSSEFNTFGYLNPVERSALNEIALVVPPTGVVGSSLNSGAVDMYADRSTFRPGYWTRDEFNSFLAAMRLANRPVYLLADGDEMHSPLVWAQQDASLVEVWQARLPFFAPDGVSSPQLVKLWRVDMPPAQN